MNPVPSHPNPIARIIFASRWIQLPIYLGLIVVQMIYAWKFLKALWHLIVNLGVMDENTIMLAVLNLIDVVMIANLLLMVIVGGYEASTPTTTLTSRNGWTTSTPRCSKSNSRWRLSASLPSTCCKPLSTPARYRRRKSSGKSFCTSPSCSRRWRWLTLTKSSTATTTPPNLITKDTP